jgi:hypothetical protein
MNGIVMNARTRKGNVDFVERNVIVRWTMKALQEVCGKNADPTTPNLDPAWRAPARLIPAHSSARRTTRQHP